MLTQRQAKDVNYGKSLSDPFNYDELIVSRNSYEVHEKLQNFMVPVPIAGAWHTEQVDELFTALLGKGFEDSGIHDKAEVEQDIDLGAALKGGFRVFG